MSLVRLTLALAVLAPPFISAADRPPNVVVIFCDDMGYADIGPFGAEVGTPNLDRMAAEGRVFTDFYAAQAVCSASRAALMTGCYPNRVGILGALGPGAKTGINPDETTVAELLKEKGYATAVYGKWHLGDEDAFRPTEHGFDEYFGLPYSNDMWPLHPDLVKLPPDAVERKRRYPDLPLWEGSRDGGHRIAIPKVTGDDQRNLTTWYTEHAVSFIERSVMEDVRVSIDPDRLRAMNLTTREVTAALAEYGVRAADGAARPAASEPPEFTVGSPEKPAPVESLGDLVVRMTAGGQAIRLKDVARVDRGRRDTPFFLYVPHSMVHVPLFVSDKFAGKSGHGLFGDVVQEIDWSVGQILDAIRRHGLEQNTLVLFTSDNGPWLSYGDHAGSAGPLREGKGTAWEGGVREPTLAWWPGRIPAGTRCSEPCGTIDLLPTVAALAGAELPKNAIDGKDISPLLFGEAGAKSPREAFFYYWGNELHAVRSGNWKLHFPHEYRSLDGKPGGTNGMPATYVPKETELALYDLANGPGERANVADANPDVVRRLTGLADAMRDDLGDSLTGRKGTGARPPGRAGE